ncbi:LANO_0H16908g1_1 [Lachancea nothofagi CBS 11611]|uniref:tRNA dimethylallyltransferase n=1 Tax=Lachancea nothofagi CBS 11611 TaxID=1266666 RepID=A0A1G4KMY5_9SACH|nr:LANO_0H16908g1_1 [Lachancea nothofagi CBS 11611]
MIRWLANKIYMPKPKVIVIAGTTGVGKSQLSIQLASHVSGEVINSDSMQVYRDIPIITNKHPIEERCGIPHHVMNHVTWDEEYYLHRFEKECLGAIEDIHSRGKVPIIVGGTHYYLQILLSKRAMQKHRKPTAEEQAILESEGNDQVYAALQEMDPVIAAKYHPNDTRRVRRMLEIYFTTGQRPSEAFAVQKNSLKFDTLFYWIYSAPETLDLRLDTRVDDMMKNGALEEIQQLYDYYKVHSFTHEQCENGVWQVIGFKEFLPWLENIPGASFDLSIERMKVRTRQYAKKQVKWIKKMLLPDVKENLYALDATNLELWDRNVLDRAISIADDFVSSQKVKEEHAPPELKCLLNSTSIGDNSPKTENDWSRYTCQACRDKDDKPLLAIGEKNWQIHLKSRRHRLNLGRAKKQENHEIWKKRKLDTPPTA